MDSLRDKAYAANFQKIFAKKGYAYFTKGAYNLNIIGIRKKGKVVTNKFDDVLIVEYKTASDRQVKRIFDITTEPGLSYMSTIYNSKGTAILVPDQYRASWKIGLHKGKYKALCQCKPVKVYRDKNRDSIYDYNPTTIDRGIFGINIHKAGEHSVVINNWSAGCQVFANSDDFSTFMRICDDQVKAKLGDKFTYTLLTEDDLDAE